MKRRGFSLVELLVVIAIIAILVALLLSAVQQARAAASKTTCANNLHQIVIAAMLHHSDYDCFPAGISEPIQVDQSAPDRRTWEMYLMPYMEQGGLYDEYCQWIAAGGTGCYAPARETEVRMYVCPSDPNSPKLHTLGGNEQGVHSNYVACAGSTEYNPGGSNGTNLDGVFYSQSATAIESITRGSSNVLGFAEILVSPDVTDHDTRGRIWNDANQGGNLFSGLNGVAPTTPDQLQWCQSIPTAPCATTYAPSPLWISTRSAHRNSLNAAYCDGHVAVVRYDVPVATFQDMCKRGP